MKNKMDRKIISSEKRDEMLAEQLQTEVIAKIPFAKREENNGSSVYDEDSLVGEVFTSLAEDIIYRG